MSKFRVLRPLYPYMRLYSSIKIYLHFLHIISTCCAIRVATKITGDFLCRCNKITPISAYQASKMWPIAQSQPLDCAVQVVDSGRSIGWPTLRYFSIRRSSFSLNRFLHWLPTVRSNKSAFCLICRIWFLTVWADLFSVLPTSTYESLVPLFWKNTDKILFSCSENRLISNFWSESLDVDSGTVDGLPLWTGRVAGILSFTGKVIPAFSTICSSFSSPFVCSLISLVCSESSSSCFFSTILIVPICACRSPISASIFLIAGFAPEPGLLLRLFLFFFLKIVNNPIFSACTESLMKI